MEPLGDTLGSRDWCLVFFGSQSDIGTSLPGPDSPFEPGREQWVWTDLGGKSVYSPSGPIRGGQT